MKKIKELGILAGASIIAAFAVNYFSPAGIALVGQWDIAKGVITANEKNDIDLDNLEIGDIALAKELYDSKKFLLILALGLHVFFYRNPRKLCVVRGRLNKSSIIILVDFVMKISATKTQKH